MTDPSYDPQNIFAKIIEGEIPSIQLFDNDDCIAIMDAFPQSQGHCLVIPKAAARNILDADPATLQAIIPHVQRLAKATKSAFAADGIRIAQFNEANAGQTVFHLHWHVIPTYEDKALEKHATAMVDVDILKERAEKIRAKL